MRDNKLNIIEIRSAELVSLPLLEKVIFKCLKLPIPYSGKEGERKAIAKYRLETGNIAFNLVRTKFIKRSPYLYNEWIVSVSQKVQSI